KQVLNEDDDTLSDNEILAELENDPELEHLRETRLNQLKHEMDHVRKLRLCGHGEYLEIQKEEDIVKLVSSEKKGIVHFMHPQFARCKVLDKHLHRLARYYFETRFVSISVEKCPFLVQKFQLRVLPCILAIVNGGVVDRLVGFEELGNNDKFSTEMLEKRLGQTGVIQ
ncbi:thioredoxin-like protein, partial [Coemansia reversa NRRL 1564]